ncbi:MAG TPA: retropepsin-like aspartic protease [Methylophilaceae bacterium]|nr:retropepsin-like aspartic protease [Methylophilaceae bacterium]
MQRTSMLLLAGLMQTGLASADTQVNVVSLYHGGAVLLINHGKPQTIEAGDTSPEGVKLISSDGGTAILEIEGRIKELAAGQGAAISSPIAQSQSGSVSLYRDTNGHYFGHGSINGRSFKYMVDTGASAVAMSSAEAQRLGIDYLAGKPAMAATAAGVVRVYQVSINSLKLGAITFYQVQGMVVEGDSPIVVLLGNSVLTRMDMKYEGMVLKLTKKY